MAAESWGENNKERGRGGEVRSFRPSFAPYPYVNSKSNMAGRITDR